MSASSKDTHELFDKTEGSGVAQTGSLDPSVENTQINSNRKSFIQLVHEYNDWFISIREGIYPHLLLREHFRHDKKLLMYRLYIIPIVFFTIWAMFLNWSVLPVFWGSMFKNTEHTDRFNGAVVNYDQDRVGNFVTQAVLASNFAPGPHNTWVERSSMEFPTADVLAHEVEPKQNYWMALSIRANATAEMMDARAKGDTNWDPRSVITIHYGTARSSGAVSSFVVKPTEKLLGTKLRELNSQLTSEFFSQNANNAEAVRTANRAPQVLVSPVGYGKNDLRPWPDSVGAAPTFIGIIYLLIMIFLLTLNEGNGHEKLNEYLDAKTVLFIRLVTPAIICFPLSLMDSLVNVAYELPYDGNFSYGGGFMVYWLATYCLCLVNFMAFASVNTMFSTRFSGTFLLVWIVSNASVIHDPVQEMNAFYQYGYMMPFYNARQFYLAIFYNVGERHVMMKYIGIIWAWMAGLYITYSIVIYLGHRTTRANMRLKERKRKEEELARTLRANDFNKG